jgi:AcrR family transcriptional regulator
MSQGVPERPRYAEGRDALLQAAARVIARDGFGGLSYRTVAREAGTTHGLVSYHFGSRDRLIEETVAKAGREAIDRAQLAPVSGQIEDFARDLVRLAEEAPDEQILQYELAMEARRRPELAPTARELYDQYITVVHETLRSLGIDASAGLARVVFAALDGLMLQHFVYGELDVTEEALAELRTVLRELADSRHA